MKKQKKKPLFLEGPHEKIQTPTKNFFFLIKDKGAFSKIKKLF